MQKIFVNLTAINQTQYLVPCSDKTGFTVFSYSIFYIQIFQFDKSKYPVTWHLSSVVCKLSYFQIKRIFLLNIITIGLDTNINNLQGSSPLMLLISSLKPKGQLKQNKHYQKSPWLVLFKNCVIGLPTSQYGCCY